MTLYGGDSAYPQPDHYTGKVWCVYVAGATPHVWTHEEVAELAQHGIDGILPICVPPQDREWWTPDGCQATLDALVAEAIAWGLPDGSPLVLDVEEAQALAMGGPGRTFGAHCWALATRARGLEPWAYGPTIYLGADLWSKRWLAEWPDPQPVDPEVPEPWDAWQYAGGVEGDTIDLDAFREPILLVRPDLAGTITLPLPAPAPDPDPPGVPDPDPEPEHEPPPPPAVTIRVPELREGATGEAVVSLQGALRAHGEVVAADGDFGPLTTEAVRRFQQRQGIAVDGIVGPVTYERLFPFPGA